MTELEKWIQKNQPFKKISRLEKYRDEINELINRSYTQNQVVEFLKDIHKIEVTQSALSQFLKKKNKTKQEKEKRKEESIKKIEIEEWLKK